MKEQQMLQLCKNRLRLFLKKKIINIKLFKRLSDEMLAVAIPRFEGAVNNLYIKCQKGADKKYLLFTLGFLSCLIDLIV